MRQLTSLVLVVVFGGALLLGVVPAAADVKADAKQLFQDGVGLLEVKDFEGAAAKFKSAVELFPTKNGLFNLANCYLALHRYQEAIDTIEALKTQFATQIKGQWQDEISTFEKKMENEVVRLEIQVNIDGAEILINGNPVGSSPLNEPLIIRRGDHEITVARNGYKPEKLNLKLWDDKESTVRVTLAKEEVSETPVEEEPAKDEAAPVKRSTSPKKIGAWVALGVGGASAVAAIIVGAKQLKLVSEIEEKCSNKVCADSLTGDRDQAYGMGVATDILVGAAVVGVTVGTILLVLDRKERQEPSRVAVAPGLLPGGGALVLSGRF